MIKLILFIILLLLIAIISLVALLKLLGQLIIKISTKEAINFVAIKKNENSLVGLLLLIIILVFVSQIAAHTPNISSADETKQSVSELISVQLNGRDEWISIRGSNINNPVILFLAGGPGGTQLGAVRRNLSSLEKNYTIVNWEQPGSGKSYNATTIANITSEIYIDDGIALTKYLLDRFNQPKLYLVGESWGSALGVFMVEKAPENYYAFIGTGQMVDFKETEITDYNMALDLALKTGDVKKEKSLLENGAPPYFGKKVALKCAEYLNYLSTEMAHNPAIHNSGFSTLEDIASSEYGIIDQINFFRGITNTFGSVYQQLYEIDLRKDYSILNVPIYFFVGRHDINAPTEFVEEYYNILDAPEKQLIWFENSGHSPWINESELFCSKLEGAFKYHE